MTDHISAHASATAARGQMAHHGGLSAENSVAAEYLRHGYAIVYRRWRGPGGEIDLIARNAQGLVFVEIKKSRSFSSAAQRINSRQIERIMASAAAFLADEPSGQLTDLRFDVALVDGHGRIRIIENAFGHG